MKQHNKYKAGSEWRKWDLHVHSPYTFLENRYNDISNNNFIDKVKDTGISVIGLTNYFKFDEKDFILKSELEKQGITVFLNLEIRLTYQNKEVQCCDLHIIFDNDLEKDTINKFLYNLTVKGKDDDKKAIDVEGEDFRSATVEFAHLLDELNNESLKVNDKYLLGFLSRGHGNSRSSTQYYSIAKDCHFLIHSSDEQDNLEKDREFWLTKNKPLLQSSDAHSLENIGGKFTWIKADPTFEGLKQILYEPKERVSIQKENPSFNFNRPSFSEVNIENQVNIFEDEKVFFAKNKMPLNKYLVTFIGGRGTGKSLFLKYLGSRFSKLDEEKFSNDENFIVSYQKENKEDGEIECYSKKDNPLDFLFIEQSKIKNITKGKQLEQEIKKLLGLEDLKFSEDLNDEILNVLQEIEKIEKWFEQKDEDDNRINSREYNNEIKKINEKLLKTITTKSNEDNLKKYTKNIKKAAEFEKQKQDIEAFKEKINQTQQELSEDIKKINLFFDDKQSLKIPQIDFKKQYQTIKTQIKFIEDTRKKIDGENKEIKETFKKEGFTGDLVNLLSNVSIYQKSIEKANQKIQQIEQEERKLNTFKNERKKLGIEISQEYERQKKILEDKWANLLKDRNKEQVELINKIILKEDINLKVSIKFNDDQFYKAIHGWVDKRSFKTINSIKEKFNNISSFEKWIEFFDKEEFSEIIYDDYFKEFIKNIFFDLSERKQYIQVVPEFTYKDKTIDKLSAGQKGTLYLRLQLATNAFSTPIIFDQPEDDLDNKFIVDELVPMLKELKKYRQIIIATHNANLVVGADAEQIIVANNENEILSYTSGSVENREIKGHICKVLEGGKEAFEQRRKKYDF